MYTQPYPYLFKPLKVKGLTFKNRIMSPPNMLFHTVDGRPTQYYISYLEHKARGGAAVVTLGEVAVCDGGNHTPWTRWTRDNLPLYAEMAAAIHEHGALCSVELTHGGRNARPEFNTVPVKGPVEGVGWMGDKVLAMDEADMNHIADAYAEAAEYWYHAGFDAVLIHAGHGWIFNQFLSPIINTRTDRYGGSLENRMRFPLMVLRRIRDRVGAGPVLMIRLSGSEHEPGGYTVEDIIEFLAAAQAYVDVAEITSDGVTNMMASTFRPLGLNVEFAEAIKKSGRITIPIFSIGSILYPEQAEEIIASGKADGVSMSRALIADPFWVKKAAEGRSDEITPCLRCLNCTDSDNASRHFVCSVNPLVGREARLGFADTIGKANVRKKVLIAGGGPAGMQSAITASRRGHEVILCEKSNALGGLLKFADTDSLKRDLLRYKEFLIRRVHNENVKILLNTEVTDEVAEKHHPDSIIVATGSRPVVPPIRGIENAHHATDIYFKPENIKGTNIVITGAAVKEVTGSGVTYLKDGKEYSAEGDTILYAVGMKPFDRPYFDLYGKAPSVYEIGDFRKVGKIDGAVHSGFFAAMDIGMI